MTIPGAAAGPTARVVRRRVWRAAAEAVSATAVMTLVYFLVPLPRPREVAPWLVISAFSLGLVGISVLITWRVIAYRQRAATGTARLRGLVVALCAGVLYFALAYSALARSDPQQFVDLTTRVDALYFSVAVLTTVGFGDVHAAGQMARAAVTVQMIFDVAFFGLAASAIRNMPPWRPAGDASQGPTRITELSAPP